MVTHSPRNCPRCGTENTTVYDSRNKDKHIRRKRSCSMCGLRYSSVEILEEDFKMVEAILSAHKEYVKKIDTVIAELDK